MQVGRYTVSTFVPDRFRLDGGAMFGSVPKVLWSRKIAADEQNRIQLACRVLVLQDGARRILVDVGMGRKWSEKEVGIYAIEYGAAGPIETAVPGVTDVILTHLHFDHGGGVTHRTAAGEVKLSFPQAKHYLHRSNWEIARKPGLRERASYLKDHVEPLAQADLVLVGNGDEILPDISGHISNGHTQGLQWILIDGGENKIAYPADLIPTSHHLSVPYVMGYDLCAQVSMQEKEAFVRRAVEENWIIVFEHDAEVAAARIKFDEKGQPVVREQVALPAWNEGSLR